MKTISTSDKYIFIFMFLLSVTNSFSQILSQMVTITLEYLNAQTVVDANASSTCQVERVFAVTKGSGTDQYLLLGINNGNGGAE
jgi:hypothetical protein